MSANASSNAGTARYFMIGGFLGAGKTTAVAALAQRLVRDGLRVGLITNDQGSELVDTAMLRARGFATEEIAGGCFCCPSIRWWMPPASSTPRPGPTPS